MHYTNHKSTYKFLAGVFFVLYTVIIKIYCRAIAVSISKLLLCCSKSVITISIMCCIIITEHFSHCCLVLHFHSFTPSTSQGHVYLRIASFTSQRTQKDHSFAGVYGNSRCLLSELYETLYCFAWAKCWDVSFKTGVTNTKKQFFKKLRNLD